MIIEKNLSITSSNKLLLSMNQQLLSIFNIVDESELQKTLYQLLQDLFVELSKGVFYESIQ